MSLQNWILSIGVTVALVLSILGLTKQTPPQLGATPGNDFQNGIMITGGNVAYGLYSTTSQATAETLTANDLRGWSKASLVSYSPGLTAAETITLPASSTISDIVPHAGDRMSFCVQNATSTAGVYLTFAGGVGTKLAVASSSITASNIGSKVLMTGKIGCFTFVREVASSTAFDIDALFTSFN